uniref:OmpA family protein n=1 Tax=Thaumasiovibrio occultus TaxID=1891184 RepID=UPI000B35228B|nr:OmpA family protein [Thaumasiovibrio occultus]
MMKLKYGVLPLAALVTFGAVASEFNPWYAGARIGNAHYTRAFQGDVLGYDDRDDFAGGVFFGYRVRPWLALEGGYTDLGEVKLNGGGWAYSGFDAVLKPTWALTENLDFFGKFGGFYFDNDAKGGINFNEDDGLVTTLGAGLEYYLTDAVSTRLEYQYYDDMVDANVHFWGVSLVYNFGAKAAPVVVAPPPVVEPEPVPVAPAVVAVEPITSNVYFGFDSGKLTQEDVEKLQPIALRLREYPQSQLYVIGHTDSKGSAEYNQRLSVDRAASVAEYLEGYFNISESRIFIEGRGEEQPIATNETEEGRARNRRVEVFTPGFEIEQ